jgi:hypothetical protein
MDGHDDVAPPLRFLWTCVICYADYVYENKLFERVSVAISVRFDPFLSYNDWTSTETDPHANKYFTVFKYIHIHFTIVWPCIHKIAMHIM